MISTKFSRWIRQHQKRNQKFSVLMEGIIGQRGYRYLFYRLKYFANITWIKVVAHLIEFYLVYHVLGKTSLAAVAILRGVFLTIKAGYWGFLEILRSKIRAQFDDNTRIVIPKIIQAWLILSVIVGMIASIIYFLLPLPSHSLFITLFSIALCVELCIQLLVFTFHSSTYALRRIMRPAASIYSLYGIELLLLIIGWPIFHIYSLPMALVITRFLSFYLTYFYTKRTGDLWLTEESSTPIQMSIKHYFSGALSLEALMATLSMIIMHSEGAIILILFVLSLSNPIHGDSSMTFFFLIAPIILSSFSWSRLMYFDFKRLEFFPLTALCLQFLKRLFRASWLIGLIFWCLTAVVAWFIYPPGKLFLAILFPFFLLRCPIAILQMHAFAMRRYWDVLISGSLILASLLFISQAQLAIHHTFAVVIVMMVLALVYLLVYSTNAIHYKTQHYTPKNLYLGLRIMERLNRERKDIQCAQLYFSDTLSTFEVSQVIHRIAKIIRNHGIVMQTDKNQCLCVTFTNHGEYRQQILLHSAGCLINYQTIEQQHLFSKKPIPSQLKTVTIRMDGKQQDLPPGLDFITVQRALRQLLQSPYEVAVTPRWYLTMQLNESGIYCLHGLSRRYRNSHRIQQWHHYWLAYNIQLLLNDTISQDANRAIFQIGFQT